MPRDILTWIRSHLDDGEAVFRDGRRIVGRAVAVLTGNNAFVGNQTITGNLTVTGRLINTGGALPSEVRCATTVNDSLAGLAARDGVTPVAGDRVLVKNHATASAVGIYVAAAGAWARAADLPVGASAAGLLVIVHEGTANADTQFLCTNDPGTDVVGTDALVFATGSVVDALLAHKAGSETFTGLKTFAAGLALSTLQTLVAGANTLISADKLNAIHLAITGQAIGDLLAADSADTFALVPDVALGAVLCSGGVGAVPAYSASPSLTALTLSGDIAAGGGFRQTLSGFTADAVAAGDNATPADATPVALGVLGVAVGMRAKRAGSIVGLAFELDADPAGSSIIVVALINGVASAASVTLAAGATRHAYATFAKDAVPFAAGDRLQLAVKTGSGWSAPGAHLVGDLQVED